jgi:hypothetical protein
VNYAKWAVSILLIGVSVLAHSGVSAQSDVVSLAGEWRFGRRVVVIEQDGAQIRGSWKEHYRDKMSCSGVWFTGEIKGDAVRGVRYLCPHNTRQPLTISIIDTNTLEIIVSNRDTNTTGKLKRIPAAVER